jgi:hypothetical protein
MKSPLKIVLALIATGLVVFAVHEYIESRERSARLETEKEINESFVELTDGLNKNLPKMLSPELRLDAAASTDTQTRYYVSFINYNAEDLPPRIVKSVSEKLRSNVCQSNQTGVVALGFKVSYVLRGADGGVVSEVVVDDLKDCAKK